MLLILDSFNGMRNIAAPNNARMAELVDASDSKSGIRKDVQVRFLFRALNIIECRFAVKSAGFNGLGRGIAFFIAGAISFFCVQDLSKFPVESFSNIISGRVESII